MVAGFYSRNFLRYLRDVVMFVQSRLNLQKPSLNKSKDLTYRSLIIHLQSKHVSKKHPLEVHPTIIVPFFIARRPNTSSVFYLGHLSKSCFMRT